jgi:DNA-binding PadR family transcriptional regulator
MNDPNDPHRTSAGPEASQQKKYEVLGHFEYAVVQALQQLGDNAYPAETTRFLNSTLKRHVSLAQVYIAIERLFEKGMVSTEVTPRSSGRRKRVFHVNTAGIEAMMNTAAAFGFTPKGEAHDQGRASNEASAQDSKNSVSTSNSWPLGRRMAS